VIDALFEQLLVLLELLRSNVAGLQLFNEIQIILAYVGHTGSVVLLILANHGSPVTCYASILLWYHEFSKVPN
jgi:hypothetical protein